MKKNYCLILGLLFFYFIVSCNRSAPGYDINKVINASNGWLSDNIYQLSLFGEWNRNLYYPVGENPIPGKIAKSGFDLRKQAEAVIFSRVKAVFDDKLRKIIQDQVPESTSGIIIDQAINNNLRKIVLKLFIIEKAYSKEHDAYILAQIEYPNLKLLVKKAAEEVEQIIQKERNKNQPEDSLEDTIITNLNSTNN